MQDDHATTSYLAEVASHPVPDAQTQLAWAHALDQAQQDFNRALLSCRAAQAQFQLLAVNTPATDTTRWLARRIFPSPTDNTAGARTEDGLHAQLRPLRLRCEFMAELSAAVGLHAERTAATLQRDVQDFLLAAEQARGAVRAATACLVQANQRLVVNLARQYRYAPMSFMDLVQEGNLGLLRAIERFDPEHGTRVSTYALWWVRRAMVYAIARQGQTVRPPVQHYWSARQIQRALSQLDNTQGRRSSLQEAARSLGISVPAILESFAALAPAVGLDAPMDDDGPSRVALLVAVDAAKPEESIMEQDLRCAVSALLEHLPPRHAKILRMRFGIGVYADCTLEQIAQQQGVTRERIRQLERQALDALRRLDAARILRGSLE